MALQQKVLEAIKELERKELDIVDYLESKFTDSEREDSLMLARPKEFIRHLLTAEANNKNSLSEQGRDGQIWQIKFLRCTNCFIIQT